MASKHKNNITPKEFYIGGKPCVIAESSSLSMAQSDKTGDKEPTNFNRSFTASFSVLNTPALEEFMKSMRESEERVRGEIDTHLRNITAGFMESHKEESQENEKNFGPEFREWFDNLLSNIMYEGLRMGWNECYNFHKDRIEQLHS